MIYHAIKLNIFSDNFWKKRTRQKNSKLFHGLKNLLNTQLLGTHLMKEGKLVYCVKIIIILGKLI